MIRLSPSFLKIQTQPARPRKVCLLPFACGLKSVVPYAHRWAHRWGQHRWGQALSFALSYALTIRLTLEVDNSSALAIAIKLYDPRSRLA